VNEIRALAEDDLEAFVWLRSVAYPGADLEPAELRRILAPRLPHSSGLFVDGDLACVATSWPMRIYLGGRLVSMSGLAGVATAPEHRRRGLVREILRALLERLRHEGVGWSLEYPFDPHFYHRLGWQSVPCGVELELPAEYLFQGAPPRSLRRLPLEQIASRSEVFESWSSRFNFTLSRVDDARDSWRRLVSDQWLHHDAFLYGSDDAYVLFTLSHETRNQVLTVEDYAYASAAGRSDLLAFLGAMQGQATLVRIHVPDDDPLALQHRTRHARSRRWPLQARIVDLATALAPLSAPEPRTLRIGVSDPLCPWNDGTFEIVVGPGGATLGRIDGRPDALVPIQSLPLLLLGNVSAASALAQGLATGDEGQLAVLASLGAGRTTFMPLSDAF
jgi:predicted acetyltransferase